jgi:hypothetical protein
MIVTARVWPRVFVSITEASATRRASLPHARFLARYCRG